MIGSASSGPACTQPPASGHRLVIDLGILWRVRKFGQLTEAGIGSAQYPHGAELTAARGHYEQFVQIHAHDLHKPEYFCLTVRHWRRAAQP